MFNRMNRRDPAAGRGPPTRGNAFNCDHQPGAWSVTPEHIPERMSEFILHRVRLNARKDAR